MAAVDETIIIGRRFDTVVWLLLKAWGIGLVVASLILASKLHAPMVNVRLVSNNEIQFTEKSLWEAISSSVILIFFIYFTAAIFTLPLLLIAGIAAYVFYEKIWRYPFTASVIAPFVGFVLINLIAPSEPLSSDLGVIGFFHLNLSNFVGVAEYLALTASAVYFSFKLRAQMLPMETP